VVYHSLSIIKYLQPLTEDLFTVQYTNYIFNDDHLPILREAYKYHLECQEINWDDKSIISSDPHIQEIKLQVLKIINL
jgi:hypothetical protein